MADGGGKRFPHKRRIIIRRSRPSANTTSTSSPGRDQPSTSRDSEGFQSQSSYQHGAIPKKPSSSSKGTTIPKKHSTSSSEGEKLSRRRQSSKHRENSGKSTGEDELGSDDQEELFKPPKRGSRKPPPSFNFEEIPADRPNVPESPFQRPDLPPRSYEPQPSTTWWNNEASQGAQPSYVQWHMFGEPDNAELYRVWNSQQQTNASGNQQIPIFGPIVTYSIQPAFEPEYLGYGYVHDEGGLFHIEDNFERRYDYWGNAYENPFHRQSSRRTSPEIDIFEYSPQPPTVAPSDHEGEDMLERLRRLGRSFEQDLHVWGQREQGIIPAVLEVDTPAPELVRLPTVGPRRGQGDVYGVHAEEDGVRVPPRANIGQGDSEGPTQTHGLWPSEPVPEQFEINSGLPNPFGAIGDRLPRRRRDEDDSVFRDADLNNRAFYEAFNDVMNASQQLRREEVVVEVPRLGESCPNSSNGDWPRCFCGAVQKSRRHREFSLETLQTALEEVLRNKLYFDQRETDVLGAITKIKKESLAETSKEEIESFEEISDDSDDSDDSDETLKAESENSD